MTTNQALVGPTDHNHVLGGPESSGSEVKHLLYSQGPKTVGGNKQRLPPGESTFLRLRLKPKDKSSRAGAKTGRSNTYGRYPDALCREGN